MRSRYTAFKVILLACLAAVLWMMGPYLLALYVGGMLAMLAYPAKRWLRDRGWGPRTTAASLTTLVALLLIGPAAGLSVLAAREGRQLGRELAGFKDSVPRSLSDALHDRPQLRNLASGLGITGTEIRSSLRSAGRSASAAILKLGMGVPEFALQLLLSVVALYFLLLDGRTFMEWVLGLGALERTVQEDLIESFRETTVSAVVAGFAAASVQAAVIGLAYLVLGVPAAFLAGALTFIFSWMPLIGSVPATAAALLFLRSEGSPARMACMAAFGLAAGLSDNLVRPLVLRGRAGMHPLVGLFAVVGGLRVFGLLGVFIGPSLAAMLISLLKSWPAAGEGASPPESRKRDAHAMAKTAR
ncbi:MAG: AI-2E family transporter [Elusimicrobia bacterium]|nr:AI-2E family transporter [Elusimicrobiota bacterium]